MKISAVALVGLGVLVLAGLVVAIVGWPGSRTAGPPSPGELVLTSARIDLPADDGALPDGPHADLVNSRCTACHSASMILLQPALSAEQWTATVTKMREAYHAPIEQADVPAIVAYLTGLSARLPGAPGGKAQDPDPAAAPRLPGHP